MYVNVDPGAIGHCEIPGTPSIQGVPFCSKPCQWIAVPSSGSVNAFVTVTSIVIAPISLYGWTGELVINQEYLPFHSVRCDGPSGDYEAVRSNSACNTVSNAPISLRRFVPVTGGSV